MALLGITLPQAPLTIPENSILPLPTIGLNLLGLPLLSVGLIGADADRFQVIDLGAGQVAIAPNAPLDYEERGDTPFELGLQATLLGNITLSSAPFTVTLTDLNDVAPTNLRFSGEGQVPENLAGATVGTLLADDPDTVNAPLTFTLEGGADAGLFEIASDGVTLKLRDGIALDYESQQTYQVQVRAFDGVNSSDATTLSILAIDLNDGVGLPVPIVGTEDDDALAGTPGNDVLQGLGGNDVLTGGAGADLLDGGAGNDTASYAGSPAGVTVDLVSGLGFGGDAEGDRLIGIENLTGSAFDDVLRGDNGANILVGGAGNDVLEGRGGGDTLIGGAGIDTAVFAGTLASYQVADQGLRILIADARGQDVLTGIERLAFADGVVAVDDGDPLFDTLYYYRTNLDVFAAGVDARAHYDSFGYREGRDPNAIFSSSGYLSANRDVAAAGLNPLEHYRQHGSAEGRDPSVLFDTAAYLALNVDVRGNGSAEPLAHYLQFGQAEGRAAVPAVGPGIRGGFDAQFYLLANPDVGRSGQDAFTHWTTFGASEGRNPNGFFDTNGYLAAYADVAAAGTNPLTHYAEFGFREGRDPSRGFDTNGYLERYPDVAAAGINPLQHYLEHGVYESRTPVGDGVFFA